MSLSGGLDDIPGWDSAAAKEPADLVGDAIKKEKLLREIVASQEDLRTLLSRVQSVQKEVDKLSSNNETLQMYIDNLTVQMAKRR